ncbi:MAG TPA: nitroreductase family protein, partial [Thermoanaerobaculia bacterium]
VEHLKLDGLCREPLVVLSFASAPSAVIEEPAAAAVETGLQPIAWERPEPREEANWEALKGFLSFDSSLAHPCAHARTKLLREPDVPVISLLPLPSGRPQPSSPAEWRSAILNRRSAKGFYKEPLTVAQIGDLLAALRDEGLPEDCTAGVASQLGVRLVAKNVEGLSGVFAYSPERHALHLIDERVDDHLPACMRQEIAGDAAALVIFHAPFCRLIDERGYSAFAELHFHAAELGQYLHLAATRLGGVGMTCLGGFDGGHCASLTRLGDGEEAIYVILLGKRNDAASKYDRLNVAFSHGHTSTQED